MGREKPKGREKRKWRPMTRHGGAKSPSRIGAAAAARSSLERLPIGWDHPVEGYRSHHEKQNMVPIEMVRAIFAKIV